MNLLVTLLLIVLGIAVCALFLGFVYAKTFDDCFSFLVNHNIETFSPSTIQKLRHNESLSTVNFDDLEMITFFIKYCNFYHEKTGQWIDANNTGDMAIISEFLIENLDTFPKGFLNK